MSFNKKLIGAVVLSSLLISLAAVPAVMAANNPPTHVSRQAPDPAKAAERLSKLYNVDAAVILKLSSGGLGPRDIRTCLTLAQATGKGPEEIAAMKTGQKSWRDIAKELNVSHDQIAKVRHEIASKGISTYFNLDQDTVIQLSGQGYKIRDIAMAGLLAKDSGKSVQDVLSYKAINNTWRDVAEKIGVPDSTFKQHQKQTKKYFHPRHAKKARPQNQA